MASELSDYHQELGHVNIKNNPIVFVSDFPLSNIRTTPNLIRHVRDIHQNIDW